MDLTQEQIEALERGDAVRVSVPQIEEDLVILRSSVLAELEAILENEREKDAWSKLGMQAASEWARENLY